MSAHEDATPRGRAARTAPRERRPASALLTGQMHGGLASPGLSDRAKAIVSAFLAEWVADEGHLLRRDSDLAWFLNPVGSLAGELSFGIRLDETYSEIPAAIERELAREQPPDVRAKYSWMARQFNEEVEWAVSVAGKEPAWIRRIRIV